MMLASKVFPAQESVDNRMLFLLDFFRALDNEAYAKELFEECVVHLKERSKEKERLREEEKVMATIHGFYAL
jgi:L-fucose isomerase-like protein